MVRPVTARIRAASSRTRRWPATWARNRTQQNLEIVRTDAERGLLFVKGSVPGSKGGWLLVRDAMKLPRHPEAPYPAAVKSAANSNNAPAETPAEAEVETTAADGAQES